MFSVVVEGKTHVFWVVSDLEAGRESWRASPAYDPDAPTLQDHDLELVISDLVAFAGYGQTFVLCHVSVRNTGTKTAEFDPSLLGAGMPFSPLRFARAEPQTIARYALSHSSATLSPGNRIGGVVGFSAARELPLHQFEIRYRDAVLGFRRPEVDTAATDKIGRVGHVNLAPWFPGRDRELAGPVSIDPSMMRPIHRPQPSHPAGETGPAVVVVEIIVAATGEVVRAEALDGPSAFVESSLRAIRTWRYEPVVVGGAPIVWKSKVTLRFNERPGATKTPTPSPTPTPGWSGNR